MRDATVAITTAVQCTNRQSPYEPDSWLARARANTLLTECIRLATARHADAACVDGVGDLVTILFQATLSRLAWVVKRFCPSQ
jgi:hypothetical protein